MSSENSFTKIPKEGLPLHEFLRNNHQMFQADPERHLKPLFAYLTELHAGELAHGAILPGCIVVSKEGEIDITLLGSRRGYPERSELPIFYPDGTGADILESMLRDRQALGAILHYIVADTTPSRRERRPLAENPASKSWPTEFIQTIDCLLEGTTPLAELTATFSIPKVVETPAPALELPPAPALPPAVEAPRANLRTIRLANAMVGREFSEKFTFPDDIEAFDFHAMEALSEVPGGLRIVGKSLVGIPEKAGDFEIKIRVALSGDFGAKIAPEFLLQLMVNPDPKSLWKNLPSNREDPFWKPDTAGKWLSEGPLSVVGASIRGRSHAHVGSFRDDDLEMDWMAESSWCSFTVADGAGSSKFSRRGSQIACEVVRHHFREHLCKPSENPFATTVAQWAAAQDDPSAKSKLENALYLLFGHAAFAARNAIDKEAAELKATARDFHTTLITSLVRLMEDGRWFIATFSIGDGAAALVGTPGGIPCLLTRPDGGEFAGQTVFLTMKEALSTTEGIMARISYHIVPSFHALLLATDGITDPHFDSDTRLAEPAAWDLVYAEMIAALSKATNLEESATMLVDWMSFHSPGHHDDRTLIIAKPAAP